MSDVPSLLRPLKDRLAAATELGEWEVRGKDVVIYAPNGFGAYRVVAWVDHAEYTPVIAASPTDQAKLIAAIEKVAGMHVMEFIEDGQYSRTRCEECLYEQTDDEQCPTVAALTQALGGDTA